MTTESEMPPLQEEVGFEHPEAGQFLDPPLDVQNQLLLKPARYSLEFLKSITFLHPLFRHLPRHLRSVLNHLGLQLLLHKVRHLVLG